MGVVVPFTLPDDAGDERLLRALRRLEQALEEQGEAVAAWQSALGALGTEVVLLDRSVAAYHASLGEVAAGAEAIGQEARRTAGLAGG